ncbi:unnamed protein product [Spirodela intermedia]|uniref:Uncharacterized protein n=1 Tax=Spirodela intermedia TaxID=51605 RepID=A0A7I8JIJ4_SPIIN|nr:unnamed protein product [Spirodela intermedia]CAA6669956.1 unnamed protein product [Spirodela intermedia]
MGSPWLLLSSLIFLSVPFTSATTSEHATVLVRVGAVAAETYDNFICATLDWWPPEKCDFDQCPWGLASALNLDLNHPHLVKAIQAFNPLRIRIGGSLQDQLVFEAPDRVCLPFKKTEGGLFGFSEGCLPGRGGTSSISSSKRPAVVTFGLNALSGRRLISGIRWGGPWNSTNARELIKYTVSKAYSVDSWNSPFPKPGNELSGRGIAARVDAEQYAKDVVELRAMVDQLYQPPLRRPLLLAPGGFYEQEWYARFLQITGPNVVDVLTHHLYNLGAGNDPNLVDRILDYRHLDYAGNTFRDVEQTLNKHGPWASAWISEAGGSYTSGGRLISDTFVNSLWYLDQLGLAAKYNTKVYCRQSLIGGNYGLLDVKNFKPNPDYYSAILWHRLMERRVLDIGISGSSFLRAHAHCAKHQAGVSLLLINLSKTTRFVVTVRNDLKVLVAEGNGIQRDDPVIRHLKEPPRREEYHLTAAGGNYQSKTMLLNGHPLELTETGDLPAMDPILTPLSFPVTVAPLSVVFVIFPNLEGKACE